MSEETTVVPNSTTKVEVVKVKGIIRSFTIGYNRSLPKPAGFSKVSVEVTFEPDEGEVFTAATIKEKFQALQAFVKAEVRKDT